MKPGVTISAARADAKSVANGIAKENSRPATYTATLFGLQDFVVKEVRPLLFLLMGAAGVLLLITCANVGGLLVARCVHRTQEIAVRVALGAQKRQLILQFLTEGLFISLFAAALGVLASIGLTRLFLALAAEYIPRSEEVSISPTVLLFAAGLVFLTALLPALAPLRQAARTQPTEVLTSGVRASAGFRSRRISNFLVIAEIAFAFLLLSAGGLLVAEFYALQHTWPGFDASHLLTFQIDAPEGQFSSSNQLLRYQRALLTALQSLPGVKSAALSNQLPLNCCMTTNIYPEGDSSNEGHEVSFVIASPSYFETLGISLKKGRVLNEHDDSGNVAGIAINAAAADGYWRGRDPVGAFGRFGSPSGDRFQVVGVVGNVSNDGRGKATRPEIYLLDALAPVRQMKLIVRSELPLSSLLPALRHSIETIGPHLPVYAVRTMAQLADDSTSLAALRVRGGHVLRGFRFGVGLPRYLQHDCLLARGAQSGVWYAHGFGRRPTRPDAADHRRQRAPGSVRSARGNSGSSRRDLDPCAFHATASLGCIALCGFSARRELPGNRSLFASGLASDIPVAHGGDSPGIGRFLDRRTPQHRDDRACHKAGTKRRGCVAEYFRRPHRSHSPRRLHHAGTGRSASGIANAVCVRLGNDL